MNREEPNTVVDALYGGARLCDESIALNMGECRLRVRSNSTELIALLAGYFSHVLATGGDAEMEVIAIEREAPELPFDFADWRREPGKTGRKDSYHDLPGARLVRKVRTGMVFLQSGEYRVAAGPCLQFNNQVINFINAQYMNWLQQRGWLICHAAGLVHKGQALGIAGFSGGGKSTLMLQLLEDSAVNYLTNDRLFIKGQDGRVQAAGMPKLPRVNPGTIVHNPRLHSLIPEHERARLLSMPKDELWEMEDKYDVMIERLYGEGRITPRAPLNAFLVLNWERDSNEALQVNPVRLGERRDLLAAIMKSPGPFYQYADGRFFQDDTPLDEQAYLDALAGVGVYEARGAIDFATLARRCIEQLMD
jgi:HprK-related kinase B